MAARPQPPTARRRPRTPKSEISVASSQACTRSIAQGISIARRCARWYRVRWAGVRRAASESGGCVLAGVCAQTRAAGTVTRPQGRAPPTKVRCCSIRASIPAFVTVRHIRFTVLSTTCARRIGKSQCPTPTSDSGGLSQPQHSRVGLPRHGHGLGRIAGARPRTPTPPPSRGPRRSANPARWSSRRSEWLEGLALGRVWAKVLVHVRLPLSAPLRPPYS